MISLISLVALSTSFTNVPEQPFWLTDYKAALVQGAHQQKPLAVFLAPGQEGWRKLSANGTLSQEVQELLGAKYVPVFIDTETAQGKELAAAFELPDEIGLVLSDRQGRYQVFRHEGSLGQKHLVAVLDRHADADGRVLTTATSLVLETSATTAVAPTAIAPLYAPSCSH